MMPDTPVDQLSFADLVNRFSALVEQNFVFEVDISFTTALEAGEVLVGAPVRQAIRFPANFANSVFVLAGSPPSASTVLTIVSIFNDSTTTVGTITVGTDGTITPATTNGAEVGVAAPGAIQVQGPATATDLSNFIGGLVSNIIQ